MFFPSRIFIIIYYNYLLIILFYIFTTLFSCYYPLGKAGMRDITLRDAVNDYLEASGANRPLIGGEETILAHIKIAANRRTKHGQSVERCSNTMPCKEEEEDTQPTNEAWAEYRAMLEHYAMQGGGRGYSTD